MSKLEVRNLFKVFGKNARRALPLLEQGWDKARIFKEKGLSVGVANASFTIEEGEIFVIMGLSGSGKSTLVRMLNRLIEPTGGQVLFDELDVAQMDDKQLLELRRRKMSMVFQSFALMPHMTVLQNAAFGLETAGLPRKERESRAQEALEKVGLGPYAKSYPKQLSGGMQQRVGLARGLAVNPDVLLMDEAFSALDPLIRTEMQDLLMELQAKEERTVVFISHDLDEAMRIGDRIAIMEGGRVIQVGTPEEILQNPADDYVRAFFRGVDPTRILTVGEIALDNHPTIVIREGKNLRAALQKLIKEDRDFGYVVDMEHRFQGVVSTDSLRDTIDRNDPASTIAKAFLVGVDPAHAGDSMQDVLPAVTAHPCPLPIVSETGRYLGVLSKTQFLRTLQRGHEESNGMESNEEAPK